MRCKKCGAELGRQDRCPECGFINGYHMSDMPSDLKEVDTLVTRKVPVKAPVKPAPVTASEQQRPTSAGTYARNQTVPPKGIEAEKYLGKAPQPEFKYHGHQKGRKKQTKRKKHKLYLLVGMMAFLLIGFLLGFLLGWCLWHQPETQKPAETGQQSEMYNSETINTDAPMTSESASETDSTPGERLNPENFDVQPKENGRMFGSQEANEAKGGGNL